MTAGTLLRAAARSFAPNKSSGLAVAAQQVRPRANDSRIGRSAASVRYFPAIALSGVAVPRDRPFGPPRPRFSRRSSSRLTEDALFLYPAFLSGTGAIVRQEG
tara:strand:+ start:188 stop:496 length:309 start_codon:yes stop_codon:yes gene_type:complete